MVILKLIGDEEISHRIYLQFCELREGVRFTGKEKENFLSVIFNCMYKLSALKYHVTNFKNIEEKKFQKLNKLALEGKASETSAEDNLDLIHELEAFLYQVKSSLDILAKIFVPVFSLKDSDVYTFGDKGEVLINLLENNIPKTYDKARVQRLINLICEAKDKWLDTVVDVRDKIYHLKGVERMLFTWKKTEKGQFVPVKPKINNHDISDIIDMICSNVLNFHQDFICLSLNCKSFPGIELISITRKPSKYVKWEYVKWGWGMILKKGK